MNNLNQECVKYLANALGVSVNMKKWQNAGRLPVFLRDIYDFYTIELIGYKLLVMMQHSDEENTPVSVRKHIDIAGKYWDVGVVYVSGYITSYNRKRLIEHKIPFIVPGNQLYLPDLGIDLREYFKKLRTKKQILSPSTQLIVLYALNKKHFGPFTPAKLAKHLEYSPMTITRAFDEIEDAELGTVRVEGKERILFFQNDGKTLWEKAKPYLRDPVRKTIWIKINNSSINNKFADAGLTALSQYSMLAEPDYVTKAVNARDWNELQHSKGITEIPSKENSAVSLQIWIYKPDILSDKNTADPYSLYLSLINDNDERIQKALEEMMENI